MKPDYRRIVWWTRRESQPTRAHLFPAARFEHGNFTALCGRPVPSVCRSLPPGHRWRDALPDEPLCWACTVAARARGWEG